ncbi:unnamed protein product [Rotaria sordida]|uniref:Uncharacterized protein n=1 Tax=Rotaria sordida TaxID=392033 RepID=A0A814VJC1_9BILA|nr:unnamed protein product [Rotaria sordida]CAF3568046.1 unnamed protein product [Rotaria sordida]
MVKSVISVDRKRTASIYGGLFCTLVIILSSITIQIRNIPPLNDYISKNISSTKPYETFEEFYPHYLRAHTQKTTRQFHYIGTTLFLLYILTKPTLLIPMIAGGLAAYSIIPFVRHLSTGLPEVILFLIIYFTGGKLLTHSFTKAFIPLLLSYGFSWIGHFGFEQNKPAAFVYPTYSFFGDIQMMYDAIKG